MAELDEDFSSSGDVEEGDDYYISEEDDEAGYYYDAVIEENFGHQSAIFSIITKESLLDAQKKDLRKVMDLLSISEHHARTLLIHYRWNVDRIFELLERMGKEILFSKAGITTVRNEEMDLSSSSECTCNICFEEIPTNLVTKMDCGHCYCNTCWTEYITMKINDGLSRRIKCMALKCNVICDEAVVRDLACKRDPRIADRFDHFLLESYVDDNDKVKWCPSVPHCGNAIHVNGDSYCEVECTCGLQFCFNCSSVAHSPCSCIMWDLWRKKCQDESETVNYLTANTKLCPKCYKPVEKDGGCNLVTCVCGQHFCWLCGGATGQQHTWNEIAGHSCGRFKDDLQVERAKRDLYRYQHYYNRCTAHGASLKKESGDLKENIKQKISTLEKRNSGILTDYNSLTDGLNMLLKSRRIISYSYPFAYYMFGEELFHGEMTNQERELKQNLFEDQQQQLESNIEKLSMLLGKEFEFFEDNEVVELMRNVVNASRVVDKLCESMYTCIEDELLYPLQQAHNIAPYSSRRLERAS